MTRRATHAMTIQTTMHAILPHRVKGTTASRRHTALMRPRFLVLAVLLAGCGSDGSSPAAQSRGVRPAAIRVTSTDFIHSGMLPAKYSCDGPGDEPVVFAGTVPAGT